MNSERIAWVARNTLFAGASQRYAQAQAWARRHTGLAAGAMLVGLGVFYVAPGLAGAPGLLVFVALAALRLDLALLLTPLTFPFWYAPKHVWGHTVFPLSEITLTLCIVVALARELGGLWRHRWQGWRAARALWSIAWRRMWQRWRWMSMAIALLTVGTAVGVAIARRPHEALRAWRWEVAEPLLYLWLMARYARGRQAARWTVWALLGSALLVAALASAQTLWLHVTITALADGNRLVPYHGRASGIIYGSGNTLGSWLARAAPLALALALRGVGRRERALAALCLALYTPALLWSASRGALAATALACLVVVGVRLSALAGVERWRRVVRDGGRWLGGATLVAGGGTLLGVWLWWRQGLAALLAGHGGTGAERLLVWLAALRMLRDHPLFGIGPDQFLYYYSDLYTRRPYWITMWQGQPTLAAREPNLAQPHNLLLEWWLSGGLLGILGFGLGLGALWWWGWRIWRAGRRSPLQDAAGAGLAATLALGVGASALAGVAHGMVDAGYFAPDLALAFWWAVAVMWGLRAAQRHDGGHESQGSQRSQGA